MFLLILQANNKNADKPTTVKRAQTSPPGSPSNFNNDNFDIPMPDAPSTSTSSKSQNSKPGASTIKKVSKPKEPKPPKEPRPKPIPKPIPPPIPHVKLPQYMKPVSNSITSAITSPVVKPLSAYRPSSFKSPAPYRSGSPGASIGINRPGIGAANNNNGSKEGSPTVGAGAFIGLRKPGAFRKPTAFGARPGVGGPGKKTFGSGITPLKRPVED
ncbi:unnamed protein product [Ambrosiozyma monospora]|uniref:Unnamed protein product n=1 Tax=Ambrosiozyma monospora TaxID=43982 RepID=A0ACB5TIF8_AMBMO|nr:unnamed protein product [Ambrosiozyma monospora]